MQYSSGKPESEQLSRIHSAMSRGVWTQHRHQQSPDSCISQITGIHRYYSNTADRLVLSGHRIRSDHLHLQSAYTPFQIWFEKRFACTWTYTVVHPVIKTSTLKWSWPPSRIMRPAPLQKSVQELPEEHVKELKAQTWPQNLSDSNLNEERYVLVISREWSYWKQQGPWEMWSLAQAC